MSQLWQPSTTLESLQSRAQLLADVRDFFAKKNVLEVETPLLSKYAASSLHLSSFQVAQGGGYLQTSPEYAMKRLLASGAPSIYQICKAFRQAERGSQHNSEFTMLEWYRLGFSLDQLIEEVCELLTSTLSIETVEHLSYRQAFVKYAEIDPFLASDDELEQRAESLIEFHFQSFCRDDFLDLIMTHCVEPNLGFDANKNPIISCVYDFPVSQAALAEIDSVDGVQVSKRCEWYVQGFELANAYQELCDADELEQRWQHDNEQRILRGFSEIEPDQNLLAAMRAGLPPCAGVAVGVDRLLMLKHGYQAIDEVISFCDERA